jgi:hypothetical protein
MTIRPGWFPEGPVSHWTGNEEDKDSYLWSLFDDKVDEVGPSKAIKLTIEEARDLHKALDYFLSRIENKGQMPYG